MFSIVVSKVCTLVVNSHILVINKLNNSSILLTEQLQFSKHCNSTSLTEISVLIFLIKISISFITSFIFGLHGKFSSSKDVKVFPV